MILPLTALTGGLQVAELIRSKIETVIIVADGQQIGVTASIGLAVCPDNAVTVKNLILEADNSLYISKRGGKNQTTANETKADQTE